MNEQIKSINHLVLGRNASPRTIADIIRYGASLKQGKRELILGDSALNRLEKAFAHQFHGVEIPIILYHHEDPREDLRQDTSMYAHPTGVIFLAMDSHNGDSAVNLNYTEKETLLNGWKQVRHFWEESPLPPGHALLCCGHTVEWHGAPGSMECPIHRKSALIYRLDILQSITDRQMGHAS